MPGRVYVAPCAEKPYGRFSVRPDTGCETVDETGVRRLRVFLGGVQTEIVEDPESVEPYAESPPVVADGGGNE